MRRDLREQAGLYAVGGLSADERLAFEAYLAADPEARREVDEFLATTARLGDTAAETPPDRLRAKVMAEVDRTRQEWPQVVPLSLARARWRRLGPLVAAAAAVVVLGGLALSLSSRVNDLEDENRVLVASDAVSVPLSGSGAGALRVVVAESVGELVVLGDRVDRLDSSMTYQLWDLDDDGPMSIGLFEPGDDGSVVEVLDSESLGDAPIELSVSIEPAGGSSAPTGPGVFTGTA